MLLNGQVKFRTSYDRNLFTVSIVKVNLNENLLSTLPRTESIWQDKCKWNYTLPDLHTYIYRSGHPKGSECVFLYLWVTVCVLPRIGFHSSTTRQASIDFILLILYFRFRCLCKLQILSQRDTNWLDLISFLIICWASRKKYISRLKRIDTLLFGHAL